MRGILIGFLSEKNSARKVSVKKEEGESTDVRTDYSQGATDDCEKGRFYSKCLGQLGQLNTLPDTLNFICYRN